MQEEFEMAQQVYQLLVNFVVTYSFQLLGGALIVVAGFIVGGWVSRVLLRIQERRNVDVTLRQFIASAMRLTVIGFFLVIALGKLGISITPLIAAIGGLAIGASFAIQGPVSNYGAGLVIILTRMYKVGDTVTVQGCTGVVTDIALAATKMVAEDGEDIIIPNKHIIGEIHRNTYERRLVEASVGIAYGDDPDKAIAVIRHVIKDTVRGATQSAPQIGIEAFDDSAIRIGYRYWVPTMEYFEAQYRVNLEVFKQFANAGVNIPFPQRDVHLINAAGE